MYPRIFLVNGGKIIGVSTYVYQKGCQVTTRMVSSSRPFIEKPVKRETGDARENESLWFKWQMVSLGFLFEHLVGPPFVSWSLKFLICVHVCTCCRNMPWNNTHTKQLSGYLQSQASEMGSMSIGTKSLLWHRAVNLVLIRRKCTTNCFVQHRHL